MKMPGVTNALPRPEGDNGTGWQAATRRNLPERAIALALTTVALCLHGINFANVGGFWRDEANSITLSLLSGLGKVWVALQHDSFPALHYVVIRGWALLFGPGDASLRFLGLFIGFLLIAALWLKSAWLERRAPVISLLFIGLNPLLIRHLDALRPNGMAALATILAFTAVWRAILRTDAIRLVLATIAILISVQLLFQDAVFILAIGTAAMVAGFHRGGWRRAVLLAIPFTAAPLTLLPYASHLRNAADWAPVAMPLPEDKSLLPGLLKVVTSPLPVMEWLWLALVVSAIAGMALRGGRGVYREERDGERLQLRIYCGVTLAVAAVVFMLFLAKGVGISPQPWHYAPMLVLLVATAETLTDGLLTNNRRRIIVLCIAVAGGAAAILPAVQQLRTRMTSMDLVAAAIAKEAGPDDLIVVIPWHNGVSFSRYYHGRAPWMSFPALKENALHRYDLLKERMKRPEGVAGDLEIVMATLHRGGKVWVVGSAFAMEPGTRIEPLPPAPLPGSGWSSSPYLSNWNKLLLAALASHAGTGEQLSLNTPWTFSQESPLIRVFNGYRE